MLELGVIDEVVEEFEEDEGMVEGWGVVEREVVEDMVEVWENVGCFWCCMNVVKEFNWG